jgi:disulfide oxidoreductase YuzD
MSLKKDDIQITIINDSRRQECEAECGIDWSSPEAVALASQRIKERFGDKRDRIELAYLDLSKDVTNPEGLAWNEAVKNRNLSFPLLLINGQLRISGRFDIRQLLDVIEVEIEIGV